MRRRSWPCSSFWLAVVAVVLAAATACAERADDSGVFEGYYYTGFETSNFVPGRTCDDRGPTYWLVSDPEAHFNEALQEAGWEPLAFQAFWVRFEGELSEPGRYGHLGAYEREVRVKKLLEIRHAPECEG